MIPWSAPDLCVWEIRAFKGIGGVVSLRRLHRFVLALGGSVRLGGRPPFTGFGPLTALKHVMCGGQFTRICFSRSSPPSNPSAGGRFFSRATHCLKLFIARVI